jgi:MauM/NapG family ferredoxin protein
MRIHAGVVRKARRWVQFGVFLVFLYLAIRPAASGAAGLFFWLDPLAGLSGMLAARRIIAALLVGSFVALLFSFVLGRAWCGWLCPMGTVLDWARGPGRRSRPNEPDLPDSWRRVKYFLLALILLLAALGNLSLIFLDPITLITRTVAVVGWPAFNALLWGLEQAAYAVPFLRGPVDVLESAGRGVILPATQPVYAAGMIVALVFAASLALNAVRPRFWCRYLCPLGALLGLIGKVAWLRREANTDCTACRRCDRACPMGTIDPSDGFRSNPSECTLCLDCAPACPRDGQSFTGHLHPARWQAQDPSRRQFLASAGGAIVTVGLLALEPASAHPSLHLVRPPGSQDPEFLARCIRCGLCIRACPTGGLEPSVSIAGWGGLWTPVLTPRQGHCDYGCNACGQVCPTGAIPALALDVKRRQVIGHAYIDRNRCIPWVDDRICLVCEEMCPLPDKAIRLEEVTVRAVDGQEVLVRRPHVLHDLCTGCGICENRCPLAGDAAIRVFAPTDLSQ